MSKSKKQSGWYGDKLKGITHAGSDDHWIRRLLTMSLAGNGAALVLFANFLKGADYEATALNMQNNAQALLLFLAGVLIIGIATFAGAWESSVRKKRDLDYKDWGEHEYQDDGDPRPEEQIFDDKYPNYRIHTRRAWLIMYVCLAVSITFFLYGFGLIGLGVTRV